MKLKLSCPSKTFLLGEYLVLNGGGALILNTEPRFELAVQTRGSGVVQGLAPESPAGQWIRQNRLVFQNVDVDFIDPHDGQGGFGASSAQYLLTHIATQILKNPGHREDFQIEPIWRAFRQLEVISHEGLRPSGADIVSQFVGGLCGFQMEPFAARAYRWPLEDYDVVIVPTGSKMATHEHLRGLKRVETDELQSVYSRAMETLAASDAGAFFDSVNDYYAELLEMGLVAEHTQVAVANLMSQPYVQAAKGCGAMGSDVIAVFVAKENRRLLDKALNDLGLRPVADANGIAGGFEMGVEEEESFIKPRAKDNLT